MLCHRISFEQKVRKCANSSLLSNTEKEILAVGAVVAMVIMYIDSCLFLTPKVYYLYRRLLRGNMVAGGSK